MVFNFNYNALIIGFIVLLLFIAVLPFLLSSSGLGSSDYDVSPFWFSGLILFTAVLGLIKYSLNPY